MTSATIVQLYPDELGVAGDRGNLLSLSARLTAAGIHHDLVEYRRGDAFPAAADAVVLGSGPLSAMHNIHADLTANADTLRRWAAEGVPIFAYGSGAELLSHGIDLIAGGTMEGLGIFPFRVTRVTERKVGYILVNTAWGQLVGFEDNASVWKLDESATSLGMVTAGSGNGDGHEGVVVGASIATQVGGPALPLNPRLGDQLVSAVAARLGIAAVPAAATEIDEYARKAREVIVANAAHVFSRI